MLSRLSTCSIVDICIICFGGWHILHQPIGHELIQYIWQTSVIMACPRSHNRLWDFAGLLLSGLTGCLGLRRFRGCLDWGLRGVVQDPLHSTSGPEHNHTDVPTIHQGSPFQQNSMLACQTLKRSTAGSTHDKQPIYRTSALLQNQAFMAQPPKSVVTQV